jgi:hypothetical protein
MKTLKLKAVHGLLFAAAGFMACLMPMKAGANVDSHTQSGPRLIYQSRSINHNIYSYLSRLAGELSIKPKLIYVSRAYGPAIHSYRHSGTEQTAEWNVEYVNKAYNPAIFSYESSIHPGYGTPVKD